MKPLLLTLIIYLCLTQTWSIEINEVIGTKNYLLVGVRDCQVSMETTLEPMLCPNHLTDVDHCPSRTACTHESARSFIWTPESPTADSELVPALFFLYLDRGKINVKGVNLTIPLFEDGSKRALHTEFVNSALFSKNIGTIQTLTGPSLHFSQIHDVIYDNIHSNLYVIARAETHTPTMKIYSYSVKPNATIAHFEFSFLSVADFPPQIKAIVDASYDTYEEKFYFHVKDGGHSFLFTLKFGSFMLNVPTFNNWQKERVFSPIRNATVSAGILYLNDRSNINQIRNYILDIKKDQPTAILCRSLHQGANEKMYILKDYDYCRILLRSNYTSSACSHLIQAASQPIEAEDDGSWSPLLTWIVIISILLNIISIAFIAYKCLGSPATLYQSPPSARDKNGKVEFYPTYISDQSGFSF
uniref:Envelope glycoprotein H n=1 Tax=Rhabditophanes sp. KR3021 TaxID=114890 RepID=A0AC35TI87_9BILA